MRLADHINIIKALPISYKPQLLKLLLEILKDHYNQSNNTIIDPPTTRTMTVEEFIEKCTYRPPQAVQPLSRRPSQNVHRIPRGRNRESSRAMRKNR